MVRLTSAAIRILDNCASGRKFHHGFSANADKWAVFYMLVSLRKREFIELVGTNYRITQAGQRALTAAKNKVN